jgi:hypothetical protein
LIVSVKLAILSRPSAGFIYNSGADRDRTGDFLPAKHMG